MHLDSIVVGNCRDWLRKLQRDSIDLVMTSPPYWTPRYPPTSFASIWGENTDCQHEWSHQSICIVCGAWKGELGLEPSSDRYVNHLLGIFKLIQRVLKPEGSFYLNIGDSPRSAPGNNFEGGAISSRIEGGMLHDGWTLIDRSIWQKPNVKSSTNERKSTSDYELLYHFAKNTQRVLLWRNVETGDWVRKRPHQRYRNLRTDEVKKWNQLRTTVPPILKSSVAITPRVLAERRLWRKVWQPFKYYYEIGAVSRLNESRVARMIHLRSEVLLGARVKPPHFEPFPEEFCVRPILSSCPPGGIVADPFAGSGTALLVAKKLGRHFLGCELNSDYVKLARRQLSAVKKHRSSQKTGTSSFD